MSFQNDDEGDGLASLFGGITPQAGEPGRRRAAPDSAEADPASAPPSTASGAPVSGAPVYPGLEPSIPASPPPAYVPPPAFTPEPPTFGSPAGAPPGFPPPAYTPPTYAAPEEPPAASPTGAFGESAAPGPAAGGQYAAPPRDGQQPYAVPQPYIPPASVPPVTAAESGPGSPPAFGTPGYPLPVPGFDHPAPTYDLPAPAAPPATSYPAPTDGLPGYTPPPAQTPPVAPSTSGLSYPGLEPSTPVYPPAAQYPPASPYPPTAQYPTGVDPSSAFGETLPDTHLAPDPQPAEPPHPLSEPQPPSEAPLLGGFAALGREPVDPQPPAAEQPAPGVAADSAYPTSSAAQPGAVEPAAHGSSTPVLRRPPGPLLPTEQPVIVAPEELSRSTTFEKIGLALAVIGGPIGLVLAVVNGVRGVRRRGWLTRLGRVSIVLALLSTIAAGVGGVTLWNIREAQLAHDQVAAASAEFCATAASNPQIVEPPVLGWPDPGATITESLTLMEAWTTRWTDLAAVSPAGLRTGLELLASRGGEVIEGVQQSRLVNDAENERVVSATASSSGVANWYETYCVTP